MILIWLYDKYFLLSQCQIYDFCLYITGWSEISIGIWYNTCNSIRLRILWSINSNCIKSKTCSVHSVLSSRRKLKLINGSTLKLVYCSFDIVPQTDWFRGDYEYCTIFFVSCTKNDEYCTNICGLLSVVKTRLI